MILKSRILMGMNKAGINAISLSKSGMLIIRQAKKHSASRLVHKFVKLELYSCCYGQKDERVVFATKDQALMDAITEFLINFEVEEISRTMPYNLRNGQRVAAIASNGAETVETERHGRQPVTVAGQLA